MTPVLSLVREKSATRCIFLDVRGQQLHLGDDISDRFGFGDSTLDARMLRVIIALALRRRGGDNGGWMTAEELSMYSHSGSTAQASAKFLEVSLRDDRCKGLRLIEYRPKTRSRGPYRLAVSPTALQLDTEACWSFLLGASPTFTQEDATDSALLLKRGRSALAQQDILTAISVGHFALRMAVEGKVNEECSKRGKRSWLAQVYSLLAHADLEAGLPHDGIVAAQRAHSLFTSINDAYGTAQILQTEAHLRGQFHDPDQLRLSEGAAHKALQKLQNTRTSARTGVSRAAFTGTLGHRMSKNGNTRRASKKLLSAYRLCLEHGSTLWAATWAIRVSQNAVQSGDLATAEEYIYLANGQADTLNISGLAALTRAMSEFLLAARRFDEAERWISRARALGTEHSMGYQKSEVERLWLRLRKGK